MLKLGGSKMQFKKFYKKNKIIINGFIMWVIPWLILFLYYPKSISFYLEDVEYSIIAMKVNLVLIGISFLIILSFSLLLKYLKKTNSKLYKPLLWMGIIIYSAIVIRLLLLINLLSGIKDL